MQNRGIPPLCNLGKKFEYINGQNLGEDLFFGGGEQNGLNLSEELFFFFGPSPNFWE